MKFYHGTNNYGLEETKKQGYLLHKRKGISPCTYLAVDKKEAEKYGDTVLEVEYDPLKNPDMNNWCRGCWQLRVYEKIDLSKILHITPYIKANVSYPLIHLTDSIFLW